MKNIPAIALCTAALAALPVRCTLAAPSLDFRDTVELSACGLRFRIMSRASEQPLPPPDAFQYEMRRGNETSRLEMYRPRDLWLASQQSAQWQDPYGNLLTVAAITHLLPDDFPRVHVSKDEYEARMQLRDVAPTKWDKTSLSRWAGHFLDSAPPAVEEHSRPPARMQDLLRFRLPHDKRLAYAFRLRQARGVSAKPSPWFFALFALGDGVDADDAERSVRTRFFTYVRPIEADDEPPDRSRLFQAGASVSDAERSPQFLASRERVASSIQNLQDWWYAETDNYIILSNMKARYRQLAKDLQRDIELLRIAYARLIPPRAKIDAVSVIRIFAEPEEYANYVPPEHQWSTGLWMPSNKELVIRPLDAGGSRQLRERILRTAYHEAFHQYIFYALDRKEAAPWFNEGHAVLFENSGIERKRVTFQEHALLLDALRRAIDEKSPTIETLLKMPYSMFYAESEEQRTRNYAMAWGLVYYLRQGAPQERDNPYGRLAEQYLVELWNRGDGFAATRATFADVDMDTFSRNFRDFWSSRKRRSAASRRKGISVTP